MLSKLAESKCAAEAFLALKLSEGKSLWFVAECVNAHLTFNGGHKADVERLRCVPDYGRAREGLARVAEYVGVSLKGLTYPDSSEPADPVKEAICILAIAMSGQRRLHQLIKYSTSRKGDQTAGLSRAIGRIKGSVQRLSGRPHLRHVITIVETVLALDGQISLDAVKRARTPEELWTGAMDGAVS